MRKRPVSQYASESVGLAIYESGELVDPDSGVAVTITRDADSVVIVPPALATRDDLGLYSFHIHSGLTDVKGDYTLRWEFEVGGYDRVFTDRYTVVDSMPFWDSMTFEERQLVANVYFRVSDTFDSREGGPYLWELYQANFNAFEVIARLMATSALDYINYTFQPAFIPPYTLNSGSKKFPEQWYGMLERAAYVEFLRHLSRSYIEQPDVHGISTGRLDRQRYREEWRKEWEDEKATFDQMLRMFKRKFLAAGAMHRAFLVAGGAAPRMFMNAARPSWRYTLVRY